MKVIGAGFGRTETMSLKQALEHLGYPCYHMSEVLKNIPRGHLGLWNSVLEGRSPEWQRIFDGYQATVDFPGCTYYRELMDAFPDSVVILTVRDPERWWRSYSRLLRLYRYLRLLSPLPIVPHERLLVYSVKDGWEPICRLLHRPIPDRPFPHENAGMSRAWRLLLGVARRGGPDEGTRR